MVGYSLEKAAVNCVIKDVLSLPTTVGKSSLYITMILVTGNVLMVNVLDVTLWGSSSSEEVGSVLVVKTILYVPALDTRISVNLTSPLISGNVQDLSDWSVIECWTSAVTYHLLFLHVCSVTSSFV